jgi:hypothetical protein
MLLTCKTSFLTPACLPAAPSCISLASLVSLSSDEEDLDLPPSPAPTTQQQHPSVTTTTSTSTTAAWQPPAPAITSSAGTTGLPVSTSATGGGGAWAVQPLSATQAAARALFTLDEDEDVGPVITSTQATNASIGNVSAHTSTGYAGGTQQGLRQGDQPSNSNSSSTTGTPPPGDAAVMAPVMPLAYGSGSKSLSRSLSLRPATTPGAAASQGSSGWSLG